MSCESFELPSSKYECCSMYVKYRVLSVLDPNYASINISFFLLKLRFRVFKYLYQCFPSDELAKELSDSENAIPFHSANFTPEQNGHMYFPDPKFLLPLYCFGTFGNNFGLHRLYGISDDDNLILKQYAEDLDPEATLQDVYNYGSDFKTSADLVNHIKSLEQAVEPIVPFVQHAVQSTICIELDEVSVLPETIVHVAHCDVLWLNEVIQPFCVKKNIPSVSVECAIVVTDYSEVVVPKFMFKWTPLPENYTVFLVYSTKVMHFRTTASLSRHRLWRSRFSTWRSLDCCIIQ